MKNKHYIALTLGIAFFTGALILGLVIGNNRRRSELELDPLKDLQVEFIGENGKGYAVLTPPDIPYGGDDEAVQRLIDSLHYAVSPDKNLTNGQTVTATIRVDQNLKKLAHVEFKQTERKFMVSSLVSSQREVRTKNNSETVSSSLESFDQIKDHLNQLQEVIVVEGVEIPVAWNLDEEAIQAYVNYVHSTSNSEQPADRTTDDWIQGQSETKTNREDASFYTKDYLENLNTTYKQAFSFGMESSQEFRIVPIIEDNKTMGYQCVFKK